MTSFEQLTKYIKELSTDEANVLLDAIKVLLASENTADIPDCLYCGSTSAIRYGHKCGKQRFRCKQCGRTFVTTTHTVMSHSRFSKGIWQEVISDTVQGNAIEYTANRNAEELAAIFTRDIAQDALVLCNGLKSYHSLSVAIDCTMKDCHELQEKEKGFFNLNTINGFHGFIKRCYHFYRGKYLNRYNVLFSVSYHKAEVLVSHLCRVLLSADYYHSGKEVQALRLLEL